MRILMRMVLWSVLVVGAGLLGGCDDTADCPADVAQGVSCSSAGLSCFTAAAQCSCSNGTWQCAVPDMRVPDLSMPRDMTPATD